MMEQNKNVRRELLSSIGHLSDEQLNQVIEKEHWTIMQVLDHLLLMEKSVTRIISDQLANGEDKTSSEKPITLTTDRSRKISAPSFVIPSNEFIGLDEMKNKLTTSRQSLCNIIDSADTSLFNKRSYPHPVFGNLSLEQWISFVGLHEKRHLAQINELKAALT